MNVIDPYSEKPVISEESRARLMVMVRDMMRRLAKEGKYPARPVPCSSSLVAEPPEALRGCETEKKEGA